jgi:collagen type III alpha
MVGKPKGAKGEGPDHRRFLETRLQRAGQRVRGADIATGVALIFVICVCCLLVAVVADQLLELSVWIRLTLWMGAFLASGAVAAWWIARPMMSSVNTLYTAKSIESAKPGMKNSFLNWAELSRNSTDVPGVIMKTIETRAAQDIARIKIEDAIQPRLVLPALYAMAAVVVLFCLYTRLTSKDLFTSFQRVLLPLADVRPPTSTHLRITFDPGEKVGSEPAPLPAGASVTIKAAMVRGKPSSIIAYVRTEGTEYDEPHELSPTSVSSEFVLTLPKRQKSFDVTVVADDFRSRSYRVPVTSAPMITDWLLTYTPPAYTQEEVFTSPKPDIDGLEGTKVRIEATSNLPLRPTGALIELPPRTVDLKLADGSDRKLVGEITLEKDGTYRLKFQDAQGRTPEFRPIHSVRVRADQPPRVEFVTPAEVEIDWPVDRPLPLRAKITDDFGLRRARLIVEKNPSPEPTVDVEKGGPGQSLGRAIAWEENLTPERLGSKVGDIFEYWIEASDSKLPISNEVSTRSQRRRLKMVAPPESKENQSTEPAGKNQEKDQQLAQANDSQEKREANTPGESSSSTEGPEGSASPPRDEIAQNETKSKSADSSNANTDGAPSSSGKSDPQGKDDLTESPESNKDGATNKEGASAGEDQSGEKDAGLRDEDRQAMEKLEKYFEKNRSSADNKNASESPKNSSSSNSNEDKSKQINPTESNEGQEQSSSSKGDGKSQQGSTSEGSSSPGADSKTESPSEANRGEPQQTESSSDQQAKPKGAGQASQEEGSSSNEGKSPKPGEAGSSESSTSKDSAGAKTESKEGDKESPSSADGSPKPEGGGDSNTPRSSKQGNDNASAAPQGNSDGSASQSESGTPQSGGQGEPTPGQDGQPDSKSTSSRPGESSKEPSSSSGEGQDSSNSPGTKPQEQAKQSDESEGGSAPSKGDEQKGKGKASDSSPGKGSESGEDGKSGKGSSEQNQPGSSKSGSESESSESSAPNKEGGNMIAGSKPGQQNGSDPKSAGTSDQINDNLGEKPELSDKKKSNLVLRELADEIKNKKIDPNLLKEMGWTEEDAKKFYDRMESSNGANDKTDPLSAARRKGFGEGTDLRQSSGRSAGKANDQQQDLFSGRRTPPPPEVRKRYEAYMKSLSAEGPSPAPNGESKPANP